MRRSHTAILSIAAVTLAACNPQTQTNEAGPETQTIQEDHPATEVPFEWLDDPLGERALNWVRGENEKTLAVFTADNRFDLFESQAADILTAPDRLPTLQSRGDFIYNYWQDRDHRFGLWRRSDYSTFLAGAPEWETLIDLDALSARDGKEWILSGVSFAPGDSSRALIFLSHKGQDASIVREYDLDAKAFVDDGFTLPESKSGVSWIDEDTLILASTLNKNVKTEAGYARTLAKWARGTPPEDAEVYYEGDFADAFISPAFTGLTGDNLAAAQRTDYQSTTYWLSNDDGGYDALPLPEKMAFIGFYDGALVLHLKQDWSPSGDAFEIGDLVLVPADALFQKQEIDSPRLLYRPAADEQVREFRIIEGRIHLNLLKQLRGQIITLDETETGFVRQVAEEFPEGFIRFGPTTPDGKAVLATFEGPLSPPALYRFESGGGKTRLYAQNNQFELEGLREEIRYARSADGTEVPYTIIYREDAELNAATPMLVYGYGGFEVTVTPRYEPIFGKLWLERGGVYVHAHLRGGGEFGPRWHQAPMLDQRPRVYEDMAAVLQDLHAGGVSAPAHTGIMGRSNGGLMVAAVMQRNPDLMNAVVVGGPLIDMLRYDKLGPGASWTAEYGDADNPDHYDFLAGYSPIQNLESNASYPAPLTITATYDDRVWPGHARRYSAQLTTLGHNNYYYEDGAGGHYWELAGGPGPGDWQKRAKARAVEFVYLAQALGLD